MTTEKIFEIVKALINDEQKILYKMIKDHLNVVLKPKRNMNKFSEEEITQYLLKNVFGKIKK